MLQSKLILNLNDLKATPSALNTYVHISAQSRAVYRVKEQHKTSLWWVQEEAMCPKGLYSTYFHLYLMCFIVIIQVLPLVELFSKYFINLLCCTFLYALLPSRIDLILHGWLYKKKT